MYVAIRPSHVSQSAFNNINVNVNINLNIVNVIVNANFNNMCPCSEASCLPALAAGAASRSETFAFSSLTCRPALVRACRALGIRGSAAFVSWMNGKCLGTC